jgi:hypothetical protein
VTEPYYRWEWFGVYRNADGTAYILAVDDNGGRTLADGLDPSEAEFLATAANEKLERSQI